MHAKQTIISKFLFSIHFQRAGIPKVHYLFGELQAMACKLFKSGEPSQEEVMQKVEQDEVLDYQQSMYVNTKMVIVR